MLHLHVILSMAKLIGINDRNKAVALLNQVAKCVDCIGIEATTQAIKSAHNIHKTKSDYEGIDNLISVICKKYKVSVEFLLSGKRCTKVNQLTALKFVCYYIMKQKNEGAIIIKASGISSYLNRNTRLVQKYYKYISEALKGNKEPYFSASIELSKLI